MFDFFKKSIVVYSPVIGRAVSIEDVPDKMFAEKMLGDGLAFQLSGNGVYAPANGEIIMLAPTKHALGIKLSNKAELMIHIGLDTVNFNGSGFELFVSGGEKIKRGQKLLQVDLSFFEKKGVNMITPMIVTSKNFKLELQPVGNVDLDTVVMKIG